MLFDRRPDAIDDVVVALEEAKLAAAGDEVVDEVRDAWMKSETCLTRGGKNEESEPDDGSEREDEDDCRRVSSFQPPALDVLDCGIEREREKGRDEDPRDDVPGQVDERDDRERRQDDSEYLENRARPDVHDPLGGGDGRHAGKPDRRAGRSLARRRPARSLGRSGALPHDGLAGGRDRVPRAAEVGQPLAVRVTGRRVPREPVEGVAGVGHLGGTRRRFPIIPAETPLPAVALPLAITAGQRARQPPLQLLLFMLSASKR